MASEQPNPDAVEAVQEYRLDLIRTMLTQMTNEERLEVLDTFKSEWCSSCGTTQPKMGICRCWDDT